MTEPWTARDANGQLLDLDRATHEYPGDVLALLTIKGSQGGVRAIFHVETESARGLRDALNRLLVEDGGSAETGGRQATLEGAQALHAAQHRQLEAAARRSAQHVDEQAGMLARLVDVLDPAAEADPSALLGTMHVILDVQRRTVASLGDLLAAVEGQP